MMQRWSEQQQALRHLLLERHQRGEAGLPLLELLQAVGTLSASVRRKQVSSDIEKALVQFSISADNTKNKTPRG